MDEKILENEIRKKFFELNQNLSSEDKIKFHFKSVENFITHIFDENQSKNVKNKLFVINLKRNKKLLNDYLDLINSEQVTVDDSEQLYRKYVGVIGEFMNRNYNFSFIGGSFRYYYFLIYIIAGIFIDVIIWYLTTNTIIGLFTVLLFFYAIFRLKIKKEKKKLYGPDY